MLQSGDGGKAVAECPFGFSRTWVTDPARAQHQVASMTRSRGTPEAPVAGIPSGDGAEGRRPARMG